MSGSHQGCQLSKQCCREQLQAADGIKTYLQVMVRKARNGRCKSVHPVHHEIINDTLITAQHGRVISPLLLFSKPPPNMDPVAQTKFGRFLHGPAKWNLARWRQCRPTGCLPLVIRPREAGNCLLARQRDSAVN